MEIVSLGVLAAMTADVLAGRTRYVIGGWEMERVKKFSVCVVLTFCMAMVAFIDLPVVNLVATVEAAEINQKSVSLLVGQTTTLKLTGNTKKVKWSSSKSSVAKVDSNGKITAKSVGTANVIAEAGRSKFVCKVTVKTDIYKTVMLSFNDLESWKKSIVAKEMELTFGGHISLSDLNGNTYYTGNIIRSKEVLSYKTINVKVSINTPGAYQTVRIKLPQKIKYQLHRHSKDIVGGKEGLGILVSGLIEGNVSWKARCSCGLTTENSWVIPTNKDMIKAASGTTVNSKSIVSYKPEYYPVNGATGDTAITLNKTFAQLYTSGQKTIQLKIITSGKNKKITWKSSKPSVAVVNSGGKVTAKKAGTAIITANVNGKKAKCEITVINPSIKLNKSKLSITLGSLVKTQLKASVNGASKKVKWKSSNTKIATVSKTGIINPKKNGKVTISATANGVTAKCVVTVKQKDTDKKSKKNIEMSNYFNMTITEAAKKLNMPIPSQGVGGCRTRKGIVLEYRNGTWVNCYAIGLWCPRDKSNVRGAWRIEGIRSKDYAVYGVTVGMSYSECKKILKKRKLSYNKKNSFSVGSTYYERYKNGKGEIQLEIKNNKCQSIAYYPA